MTAETGGDDAACDHLEYRTSAPGADADDPSFETARAYCTVVESFVQPVRADVCNARYDLSPAAHCEFYREAEDIEDPWLTGATAEKGEDGDADGHGDREEDEEP